MNPITNHGSVVLNKIHAIIIETFIDCHLEASSIVLLSSSFHMLSLCCVESLPFDF